MASKKANKNSMFNDNGSENEHAAWNVLIYMAADNNLKEESVFTLTEIMRACVNFPFRVIAQLDSGDSVTRYDFGGLIAGAGRSDLLALGKPISPGPSDAKMLEDFLLQNMDRNALNLVVLSGHGSGAVGDFLPSEDPPSALSIPNLKSVLSRVKERMGKIDVLGMDSCLMSMAEVCYELRGEVNFLVGAEGFARNTGWPYGEILATLRQNPAPTPEAMARSIVAEYVRYYSAYTISGVSVDQAACNLAYADELKEKVQLLVGALTGTENAQMAKTFEADDQSVRINHRQIQNALILAHWRAQSYKFEQYVDLWDFCDLLKTDPVDGEVQEACDKVKKVIEKLVLDSRHSGSAFQHSHGLSIYFPWAKVDLDHNLQAYQNLAFDQATGWGREFLNAYGKKTQRDYRRDPQRPDAVPIPAPLSFGIEIGLGVAPTVRTNVVEGTKTNIVEGTMANLGLTGGRIIIPLVKNPPDKFVRFDDGQNIDPNGLAEKQISKNATKANKPTNGQYTGSGV